MLPRRILVPVASAVAAVTLLAACGDSSTDDSTDTSANASSSTDTALESTPSADKPEVDTPEEMPTELVVTVLQEGSGPAAADGDTVIVDYVGVLSETGEEFDNSYDRGSPFPVTLGSGGVIEGWEKGLQGAQAGSRIQLDIPSELAYGEQGSGSVIGPNAPLTFVIDVRAVVGAIDPADAPTDVELPSTTDGDGVVVEDVVEGEGDAIAAGQSAWVAYIAYDSEGNVLENSWEAGRPTQFPLDPAATPVPGLVEGITGMKPGGRRIVVIPADQAFDGAGNEQLGLEAGEPLIMVVDLITVS